MQSCLSANKEGKITLSIEAVEKLPPHAYAYLLPVNGNVAFNLPDKVLAVSDTTQQLVLKRMMQSIIQQLTVASQTHSPSQTNSPAQSISLRECYVVRYVAGYVVYSS